MATSLSPRALRSQFSTMAKGMVLNRQNASHEIYVTIDKILTAALPLVNQQCKELTETETGNPTLLFRTWAVVIDSHSLTKSLHCDSRLPAHATLT